MLSLQDDGIVVQRGQKGYAMDLEQVPEVLREHLGTEATSALLRVLDVSHREERTTVIAACTDRFERRLVEEISSVRLQLTQVEASLRKDMTEMGASIRQDMATNRVELLKWSFLFWVGQVVAVAAIMGTMLRLFRP